MKTTQKIVISILSMLMLTVLLLATFYLENKSPIVIIFWSLNLSIAIVSLSFLLASMVFGKKVDYIFTSVVTIYVIAICTAFYTLIQ